MRLRKKAVFLCPLTGQRTKPFADPESFRGASRFFENARNSGKKVGSSRKIGTGPCRTQMARLREPPRSVGTIAATMGHFCRISKRFQIHPSPASPLSN